MRFELKKILCNRWILLLLLGVLLVNGLLFYQYASGDSDGVSMKEIQEQYHRGIDLYDREKKLWEVITNPEELSTPAFEVALDEYTQVSAAMKRILEAESYEEIRTNLISQSQIKIMLGLFGEENSFAVRSLRQGVKDYEDLEGVTPEIGFFGNVELITNWHFTDALLLAFAVLPALFLFPYERGIGLQALTHPKRFGRYHLFKQKYTTCLVLTLCGAVLLYGTNYLIVRLMFGPISFSAPVQSVYGYSTCPEKISVGNFLLLLFGEKLLWILACMSIIVLFSVCSGSSAVVLGMVVGGLGLSWGMSQSNLLWLRWLSLVRLAASEELFQGAVYLNLAGHPIQRLQVCTVYLVLLIVAAFFIGNLFYCRLPVVGGLSAAPTMHRLLHTNLMLQEAEKSLILWKGVVLLLALATVQLYAYHDYSSATDLDELYYRSYSRSLAGLPNEDKEFLIYQQTSAFEEIEIKLAAFSEKYGVDSPEYHRAIDRMSEKLCEKEAFIRAKNQYEALSPGQSYLYETPYTILLGPDRKLTDAINYGKAFFVLTLLFSAFFAGEKETGMAILHVAYGKKKQIFHRKIVLLFVYTLVVVLLTFVPRIWAVFSAFGGLELSAWANSTIWWQAFPDGITVAGAFTLQLLINYFVCLVASGVVCFLSNRIGNTVLTMVIALSCLLVPDGIVYLLQ